MNPIKKIARRGCDEQPTGRGFHAAFYANMFVPYHREWTDLIERKTKEGIDLQEEIYERTGNGTTIGMVYTEESGDFVYLYEVDNYGNRCSVAFTHRVIAKGGERIGR